jgi:phosphonate transport system substrate-binding protein
MLIQHLADQEPSIVNPYLSSVVVTLMAIALPGAAWADLRVGMIPDVNPSRLVRDARPLATFLEKKTGQKVELSVPTNYAAVVEALVNGQLDFAYLGGFTYLQAKRRAGVVPLVQRESDRHFHSLFLTQARSSIHGLKDLRGRTFAFGDVNSTSGHLMPAHFLRQAGIDPDHAFAQTLFTGGHDATALAIANGKVDAGAIDETVFKRLLERGMIRADQVRVFYTTPAFPDYVWVARRGLDKAIQAKLAEAFLGLKPGHSSDRLLLDLLRGKSFVRAEAAAYRGLEQAALDEHLLR